MTCRKATDVANAMQEKFGERIALKIYLAGSPEAAHYPLRGATNLFVNGEWVALDVATDKEKMTAYLEGFLA